MKAFETEWRIRFERFGRTSTDEHAVSGWSAEGLNRRFAAFERLLPALDLPRHARVLELGCGSGKYVRFLAERGHRVVGMDYALSTLAWARRADDGGRGHYVAADGYELPFAPGSFDLVLCIGVLQVLTQPERLLDGIARALRPGGVALVEGLNARELPALARRLADRLRRRPPRLRCYPPRALGRWLEERGVRPVHQVGIYLPPRQIPRLGRVFDAPAVRHLLDATPSVALALAHAVWLWGHKAR